MKVKELIKQLQNIDSELDIIFLLGNTSSEAPYATITKLTKETLYLQENGEPYYDVVTNDQVFLEELTVEEQKKYLKEVIVLEKKFYII